MSRVCPKRVASRWIGAAVCCVVVAAAATAYPQDWPQWRGVHRDGKVAGFTVPETWPKALTQKWRTAVGSGDATPAVVGEKLYVFVRQGDEEVILCLSAADGSELWREGYAAEAVRGPAGRHPGPRSSPAVAEGKIVTLGVGGVVSCLDAARGKLIWQKDPFPKTVPMFYTATSPIVIDGQAIVHVGGPGKGAIIAWDLASGEEKWRWAEEGPEYASPILLTVDGTKQIVTLTEKSIVGVGAADGKLLWRLPFVPQQRAYNASTPIVEGQTVIYAGAGRGTHAISIENRGDGFAPKELWSNPDLAPQYNTPVLLGGFLYGISNRGNFYCINAKTGETAWMDPVPRDRGGFGTMVDAGSVLLALPSSGELFALAPSEKEYTELARIKVANTPTYALPVIVGNRIFVKDEDSVTFWTIQ